METLRKLHAIRIPVMRIAILLAILNAMLMSGCQGKTTNGCRPTLRLAVTTSTRDSGLLDQLVPAFEALHQARVDVIAVGTGAALKLGEAGDVDVVWVHSKQAEEAFMAAGYGSRREEVMYNEFVVLGPSSDPAGVRDLSPSAALNQIASREAKFVSRGDQSGTHQRELKLWTENSGWKLWDGYLESGQGMGATLVMAHQMQAYVLSDQGSYLKYRSNLDLVPLVASSESLRNPYGILVVNAKKHRAINVTLANAFVDFIISEDAQTRIRDYRIDGEQLFQPLRLSGS